MQLNNTITLDDKFPFLEKLPEPKYKSEIDIDRSNYFRFTRILRFIVRNKCILEHRSNIESDDWKRGTLRDFLLYATGLPYKEDERFSGFQDYLRFWRIKTHPTKEEINKLCTLKDNEEY